ncbi:hypothetical protein [Oceanibaculum nanhaiense]|uniref:hypothetical protein n=1 Tax=Oceanibaculum nanhaiense TaxID=1909734 RepID=UPI003D29F8E2
MPEIITPYGTWDLPAQWDANNGYGFRAIDSVDGTSVVRLLAPALALTKQAEDARDAAQGALAGALAAMPTRWSFDTATGAADPGSGKLRLNNATQNAATAIYVDSLNADSVSVAALLAALGGSDSAVKATITLIETADPTKWLEFSVSGVTDSTGYYTLAVSNVGGSAASPFSASDEIALARIPHTGGQGRSGGPGRCRPAGRSRRYR